jgi:hypothetical protein
MTAIETQVREVVERTRRIETRLTKYMEDRGFETKIKRPSWRNSCQVHVSSPSVSIADILATVPENWDREEEVLVYHDGTHIFSFYLP